jgi:hypothetical protein
MKNIKEARREGSHIVVYFEDGEKEAVLCESVRGGLAWPETIETPTYYCVFGQSPMPNKNGKKPLRFLIEAQEELPDNLYEKLILDSRRLLCWEYFVDLVNENNLDFYRGFNRFMKKRDLNRIDLHRASVSNFTAGLLVIKDWISNEALDIPGDSILGQQLGNIRKADQGQESMNYAVNCLRFVIGSFEIPPFFARPVEETPFYFG